MYSLSLEGGSLEIYRFLHLSPWRMVLVLVVALASGVVTAGVLRDGTGEAYSAKGVVFLRSAAPLGQDAFSLDPFLGDFERALALPSVVAQAAAAADLDPADVEFEPQRAQSGSVVELEAVAQEPEQAKTLVLEASRAALTVVLEQDLARAERELEDANVRALEARAAVEAFRIDNGTRDPLDDFRINQQIMSSIELQLLDPNLPNDTADSLSRQRPTVQAEIDRLEPLIDPYQDLAQELTRAENLREQPQAQVDSIEAALNAAQSGDPIYIEDAEPVSSNAAMVAGAGTAVVMTGVLLIGLLLLVDALRSGPRVGRGRSIDIPSDLMWTSGRGRRGESGSGDAPPAPAVLPSQPPESVEVDESVPPVRPVEVDESARPVESVEVEEFEPPESVESVEGDAFEPPVESVEVDESVRPVESVEVDENGSAVEGAEPAKVEAVEATGAEGVRSYVERWGEDRLTPVQLSLLQRWNRWRSGARSRAAVGLVLPDATEPAEVEPAEAGRAEATPPFEVVELGDLVQVDEPVDGTDRAVEPDVGGGESADGETDESADEVAADDDEADEREAGGSAESGVGDTADGETDGPADGEAGETVDGETDGSADGEAGDTADGETDGPADGEGDGPAADDEADRREDGGADSVADDGTAVPANAWLTEAEGL